MNYISQHRGDEHQPLLRPHGGESAGSDTYYLKQISQNPRKEQDSCPRPPVAEIPPSMQN